MKPGNIYHYIRISLLILLSVPILAQQSSITFVENKGQWPNPFDFRCQMPGTNVYVQNNGFLIDSWDMKKYTEILQCAHTGKDGCMPEDITYKRHTYAIRFEGSNPAALVGSRPEPYYQNYFLGNDPSRWKGNIKVYRKIMYSNLYPGIDLDLYGTGNLLKYDLIVRPGADPSLIQVLYEGVNSLKIRQGMLVVQTSLGEVLETEPYVYQMYGSEKKKIACRYSLANGKVRYEFPQGYDSSLPLIIDPTLIFSTFTGATSDNWGYTATYDDAGNGFAGGIVFGQGYPVSLGATQATFGGGVIDISISKFNQTGTNLLYSTFLGGSGADMPHSMIVDSQNNLIVFGNTGSLNFPTPSGAFSTTHNGGSPISFWNGLVNYPSGSDFFVTKIAANGTSILNSTYVGGSGNDGLNQAPGLRYNYADEFRGEVMVDPSDNVYFISTTQSPNLPATGGFQTSFGGGAFDAYVCKLNPSLGSVLGSSYFGGNSEDAGYGLQINSAGDVYICGGTQSTNLPVTPGCVNPAYGGATDGFLCRLSPNLNTLSACTYIGTPNHNQAYLLQIDYDDDVYVAGQSVGGYFVQPGPSGVVYSTSSGSQFIHKMNPALTQTLMATNFGAPTVSINISPTAFLVDRCKFIYFTGWGGEVNSPQIENGPGGSTSGLFVTPDAAQSTTDGSDFYLIVFKEDAAGVDYATFFGGPVSDEHVDGGTSRFSKDGIVYHAVCAGCGGHDDMPTTPGAYSALNNSTNCNLALFKFDMSVYTPIIQQAAFNNLCAGTNVTFNNISTGASLATFTWFFGDGDSANTFNAVHQYAQPGVYEVMLVAQSTLGCIPSDTAFATVTVINDPDLTSSVSGSLCPGSSTTITASGGDNYLWLPAPGLNPADQNNPAPVVSPTVTTTYTVVATNICGSDTLQITVPVYDFSIQVSNNDTICSGQQTQLSASGGNTYLWSPSTGLSNPNSPTPMASPTSSTNYIVTVTDVHNCQLSDTVYIQIDSFPVANAGPDTTICLGDAVILQGSGGTYYNWISSSTVLNPSSPQTLSYPTQDQTYILAASNTCGTDFDTLQVSVIVIQTSAGPDTLVCPGERVRLYATGGVEYFWSPSQFLDSSNIRTPLALPVQSTQYTVLVIDSFGCKKLDYASVSLFSLPNISAGNDQIIDYGDTVTLFAGNMPGTYAWSPPGSVACPTCNLTSARPFETTVYHLTYTDLNGCKINDSLTVYIRGDIYIPNTFTPNANDLNEWFNPRGVDVKNFRMLIFNRWGEEIFSSESLDKGWDGTYLGKPVPQGVYVWKIYYTFVTGEEGNRIGHVNLIR